MPERWPPIRRWRVGLGCAAALSGTWLVGTLVADAHLAQTSASALRPFTCTSIGTSPGRTWSFDVSDGAWRVTHTIEGSTGNVVLTLPSARVTHTADAVSLNARTANGGIDVSLEGPWASATLDAYVNYELEVNVDASLTPAIDEIATEAPTGVRCVRQTH